MIGDLIERAIAAFNAGDAVAFASTFASDGVMMDYPDTLAGKGHEQIQEYMGKLFAAFPRAKVELRGRFDLGLRQITCERFDRGDGTPQYNAGLVYTLSAAGIARMDFVRAIPDGALNG